MKSFQNISNKVNNEMKNSNFENSSFNKDKQDDFIKLSFEKKDEEHNKLIIEFTKLSLRNKELEKKLQEKDKQIQYYKDKYESRNYNEINVNIEESNNLKFNMEKRELINEIKRKDDIIGDQKNLLEKQKQSFEKQKQILAEKERLIEEKERLIEEKEKTIKENKKDIKKLQDIIDTYNHFNYIENRQFSMMYDKNIDNNILEANPNFNEDNKSQDGTCNSTYLNKKTK